jgi:hypothetical protein
MTEPLTGVRGTKYSQGTESSLVRDVADKIYLLQPDDAPLTTFTRGIGGKEVADNPKFEWLEDDLKPGTVTVSGSVGTSTTLVITAGQDTRLRAGDILIAPSGESMLATTVTSATNIAVTRSMGAVTSDTLADGDQLVIAGNALAEGSDAVASVYTKKETLYNYVQIFKDTVTLTEVQDASKSYGGADRKYQQMKKAIEHKRGIEQAFLLGDRFEETTGQAIRGTGGLNFFITSNVTNVGGVLTEADFEDFLRTLFRYSPAMSSPKKLMLANPIMISGINFWAKNALQISQSEKSYGIRIATYRSGHGDLDIVRHWLLSDLTEWDDYSFFLDPANIKYRYLPGLDTKLHLDTGAKSISSFQDEYRTYCGLQVMQEKTHGILHGITGFAA